MPEIDTEQLRKIGIQLRNGNASGVHSSQYFESADEIDRLRDAIGRAIEYDTQLPRAVSGILKDAVGYKEVEDVADDNQ